MAGTVLCPLTLYQSELGYSAPHADRVNAFLKQKQFLGDEGHWSLIIVKPLPTGDAGIEQLLFQRADYDVLNDPQVIARDAETVPPGFALRTCVTVEQARVLVTREQRSHRKRIIFWNDLDEILMKPISIITTCNWIMMLRCGIIHLSPLLPHRN